MAGVEKGAVLVTGAAKRIGREIALDLARAGWRVGVHHFTSTADAEEVVARIRAEGGVAEALQANLEREDEVATLVPRACERLGPLTALVNNASVFEHDDIHTMTRASWDRHLETNLRAPLVLSQAFAEQMHKRPPARSPAEADGCIVNILDQRVWNLTPYFLSYTVSKAGLWTLTQTLALALAPRIRVNAIGPGPTLRNDRQTEEHFRSQCESVPLRRGTTPGEICDALRFILSAPALTGQMIALDGGEHMGWAQPARGFVPKE